MDEGVDVDGRGCVKKNLLLLEIQKIILSLLTPLTVNYFYVLLLFHVNFLLMIFSFLIHFLHLKQLFVEILSLSRRKKISHVNKKTWMGGDGRVSSPE